MSEYYCAGTASIGCDGASYGIPSVTYAYDGNVSYGQGHLTSVSNAAATLAYAYNLADALTVVT